MESVKFHPAGSPSDTNIISPQGGFFASVVHLTFFKITHLYKISS